MINWEKTLENGKWFHWTGITPALCKGSYETLLQGLKVARKNNGSAVSIDTSLHGLIIKIPYS